MPLPLLFTEDVEQPPADEEENITRIISILRQTLEQRLERSGQARRDVHVKSHGCAAAEFQVRSELPAELAQGLFAGPRTYPAFVRFSNSAPWPQPDAVPDGRGLALQVEHDLALRSDGEDLGRTQDFVMVNHPTFIARDVKDYLRLEEVRLQATRQPVRLAVKMLTSALNPLRWRWRAILAAAQGGGTASFPSGELHVLQHGPFPVRELYRQISSCPRQLAAEFPTRKVGHIRLAGRRHAPPARSDTLARRNQVRLPSSASHFRAVDAN